MRVWAVLLIGALGLGTLEPGSKAFAESRNAPRGESRIESSFDWESWRYLPVQNGGRYKPFDTLAWETCRYLSNRVKFEDPLSQEGKKKLDPIAVYLAMLFDWQGWGRPPGAHALDAGRDAVYFEHHKPDHWDRGPMLRIDFLELRAALKLPKDKKYVSPWTLSQAKIAPPHSSEPTSFLAWAEKLSRQQDKQGLTTLEKKGVELANKFWTYQSHRMGLELRVLPVPENEDRQWFAVSDLMRFELDDQNDPSGKIREVKEQLEKARTAYLSGSADEFNQASATFLAAVEQHGPKLGEYPERNNIDLEVKYNHLVPFRFAWIFSTLAFLVLLLSMAIGWRPFYLLGWASFVVGLIAMLIGFGLRTAISGNAPVANMYETVVCLGLGTAVLGMIFELIYRKKFVLTVAAAISTVALILADNCPAVLDPSIRPLLPVLRDNFWLVTHVLSIALSYAALAFALGTGNITLGYFLVGSQNRAAILEQSQITYRSIQIGVLLLALGTILGGVWADSAWGRFWGWDPKEVWALIALLGYLAVLHARRTGWVAHRGLAALSVLCFSLVVMTWYGVNYVLGTGLHSYGSGGEGGQLYVFGAILLQFIYVAVALIMSNLALRASKPDDHSFNAEP